MIKPDKTNYEILSTILKEKQLSAYRLAKLTKLPYMTIRYRLDLLKKEGYITTTTTNGNGRQINLVKTSDEIVLMGNLQQEIIIVFKEKGIFVIPKNILKDIDVKSKGKKINISFET